MTINNRAARLTVNVALLVLCLLATMLTLGATATEQVAPGSTILHLTLNGQGCNPGPQLCKMRRYDLQVEQDDEMHWYEGHTDLDGFADVTVPYGPGPLRWWIRVDGWLANSAQDTIACAAQPCEFPIGFQARTGDADSSNVVGSTDFTIVKSAIGSQPGDPNWDQRADLNRTDTVDTADFTLLKTNYGLAGPEPYP